MTQYVWQNPKWPEFSLNYESVVKILGECRMHQGMLIQQVSSLGLDLGLKAQLEALTEEAVKTAEIEGERFNRDSVRSSLAHRLGLPTAGLPPSQRSVDGLVDVLLDATRPDDRPLTADRLKGWHAALFPTGYSGLYPIKVAQWRSDQMVVASGPEGRQKVHYEAPPPERVEEEMQRFFEWWANTHPSKKDIDPFLRAGIAHYWFVAIHPFDDGNGRIARAIADMALSQSDGAAKRCYSLSSVIMNNRNEYYRILDRTSKGSGDLTEWMSWFLDCHKQAILDSQGTINKVLGVTRFWQNISGLQLNDRQLKVMNRLVEAGENGFEGKLTAHKYQAIAKTSRATGTRDLADLVEKEVLISEGERRGTKYDLNWELTKPGHWVASKIKNDNDDGIQM